MKIKSKKPKVNRYCTDCGYRLIYEPSLSRPKLPNEYRFLVYSCENCTQWDKNPKLISIKRDLVADTLTTINIEIKQASKQNKAAADARKKISRHFERLQLKKQLAAEVKQSKIESEKWNKSLEKSEIIAN